MKLFYSTDHASHYPVGCASIILAENEDEARTLLDAELKANGLGAKLYSLHELDMSRPKALVLVNGDY